VVAGDVAAHTDPRYKDYVQSIFSHHSRGILVPGNHDVWGATSPIDRAHDHIDRICASLNTPVTMLRAGHWGADIPGTRTRVVGATLWTNIPKSFTSLANSFMNDYKSINTAPNTPITVAEINAMHLRDREWIARAVKEAARVGKAAVVVTHHSPDRALSVNNPHKAMNGLGVFYYCDDMADVMKFPNIAAWVYGHTHESRVTRLRGYQYPFVTNALGYPQERTGYAEGAKIEIP
jgi:hypothetical protein